MEINGQQYCLVSNIFLLCHTGLYQHEKFDDRILIWVNYPFELRLKSFILSLHLKGCITTTVEWLSRVSRQAPCPSVLSWLKQTWWRPCSTLDSCAFSLWLHRSPFISSQSTWRTVRRKCTYTFVQKKEGRVQWNGKAYLVLNGSPSRFTWTFFTQTLSLSKFPFKLSSGFHDLTGLSRIRTVSTVWVLFVCVMPTQFHSGVRSMKTKLSYVFEHSEGISKCIPHSPEWFSAEQHQTPSLIVQYFWVFLSLSLTAVF